MEIDALGKMSGITGINFEAALSEALALLRVESVTLRRAITDRDYRPKTASIEYLPDEFVAKACRALLLDPRREEDRIACMDGEPATAPPAGEE